MALLLERVAYASRASASTFVFAPTQGNGHRKRSGLTLISRERNPEAEFLIQIEDALGQVYFNMIMCNICRTYLAQQQHNAFTQDESYTDLLSFGHESPLVVKTS